MFRILIVCLIAVNIVLLSYMYSITRPPDIDKMVGIRERSLVARGYGHSVNMLLLLQKNGKRSKIKNISLST